MRGALWFGLIGLFSATPALAQYTGPQFVPDEESDTVAVFADDANRMTVPVFINGQGPFQFVIDTGADRTVISTELAEKLNLPRDKNAKLHSMGGQSEVRIVKIDSVRVSNNVTHHVRAAALSSRNLGADGLLGIDSLKGQRIDMDFETKTMRVVPSRTPEEQLPANAEQIVVTARTRLGQLVMVDADANGDRIWVVVDTGAQNSIGNHQLRRMLVKRNPENPIKSIQLIDVVGRRLPADYTIVGKVRIGGIEMGNAAVAFAEAHPFNLFGLTKKPSMLLGMESLRFFKRVSIDFATRKVKFVLQQESAVPPPGLMVAAKEEVVAPGAERVVRD